MLVWRILKVAPSLFLLMADMATRGLQLRLLHSTAELRQAAAAWDDLWSRSAVVHPTARAAMLADCQEQFAPRRRFFAAMVFDGRDAVAALPLTAGRFGPLRAAVLPGNVWAPGGELLVDPENDPQEATGVLLSGLQQSGWGLLRWDEVPWQSTAWKSLSQACDRAGLLSAMAPQYSVGMVDIDHDWNGYMRSRSRSFRRHMRVIEHRVAGREVQLERHEQLEPGEVEAILAPCLELEANGWKGRAGTAVCCVPGMRDYYLRHARQLAAWRCLCLTLLRVDGRLAAFEYGWRAKGAFSIMKIGFDESLPQLSPGQLLRRVWLEQVFAEPDALCVDFVGPLNRATRQWATSQYSVSRVLTATGGPVSRAVVRAARWRSRRHADAVNVEVPSNEIRTPPVAAMTGA